MRALLVISILAATSYSCKPRQDEARLRSVVSVGDDGQVFVFFKSGRNITARKCPDLTIIDTKEEIESKCPSTGSNQRIFPVATFAPRLKGVFFAPSMKESAEASRFKDFLQHDPRNLEKVAISNTEMRKKIESIETFTARFPGSEGKYREELASLKKQLTGNAALQEIIDGYNAVVDGVVDAILDEQKIVYVEFGKEQDRLIVNMLRSLYSESFDEDYSQNNVTVADYHQDARPSSGWLGLVGALGDEVFVKHQTTDKTTLIPWGSQSQKIEIPGSNVGTVVSLTSNGHLVYVKDYQQVYTYDLKSRKETQVFSSRDGRNLVEGSVQVLRDGCVTYSSDNRNLNMMCGTTDVNLLKTPDSRDVWFSSVSELPDGSIAFSGVLGGKNLQIHVYDRNTKKVRSLTTDSDGRGGSSSFHSAPLPGGQIAYVSNSRTSGEYDLWVVDPKNGKKTLTAMKIAGDRIVVDDMGNMYTPISDSSSFRVQKVSQNSSRSPTFNPQPSGSGNSTGNSGNSNSGASGVTMQDVKDAIARSIARYDAYNKDSGAVSGCKSAGKSAGWTQTMQDYYCVFPGGSANANYGPQIRECFTNSVRGVSPFAKRSYPDAYDFCATTHTGTPMKWIQDTQDAVFRAVMLDKKF